MTAIRRRKNSYDMLQDENGEWVGNQDQLEAMITIFYKKLFTADGSIAPAPIRGAFPPLSEADCASLSRNVTRSDIFNVVNHMNPFKAPGSDGLQAVFFQSQWKHVGEPLCKLILEIFSTPKKVSEINDTLITLVPKVEPVACVRNFRPISLCNVAYKVVTKILAQRLRPLMASLVHPCQSSFIPNRHSRDNIILAQEIFHSMKGKKGKKGWMAVKLDLEKAYD